MRLFLKVGFFIRYVLSSLFDSLIFVGYGRQSRTFRRCLIWALFLLGFQFVSGQTLLRGEVRLPDSSAASMALVKVLESDSMTLYRYVRANSIGQWSIEKMVPGQYVLQVAFLGLETWSKRIEIQAGTEELFFGIILQEKPLTLKLVEISATRVGIIERGDTLQYDLSYYLDSTEYNLKDILNRLPDISVSDDGSIRYKGKRVNLALVEGRDLFGNLHKAMTEGISAEHVKGVQIIRDYKTGAEQEGRSITDRVALNVQLTDEARQKINGDAGFGTDAHRFAEGSATLYQSRPKWGYSFIARGNNTGQSVVFPADLFALLDIANLELPKGSAKLEELLPPFIVPSPDAQRNLDLLGALNVDVTFSPRWNSKMNFRFIKADRRMENALFRLYIQDNTEFVGTRSRRDDANLWQVNFKNDYRGRGRWLKQQLHLSPLLAPRQALLNGSLAGVSLENQFFRRTNQLDLYADLEAGFGIDSLRMLTGRVQYWYNGLSERIRLQSPDVLFNTSDTLLTQKNVSRESTISGEVSLRRQIVAQQLVFSAGYACTSHLLAANTLPQQLTGQWDLSAGVRDEGVYGAIALRRSGQKRYHASIRTTLLQRKFLNQPVEQHRYLLTNIKVGVYYDFALLHNLYVSGGYNTSPTPFLHLWRYNRIRDDNSLYVERVDSSFLQQEVYVSVSYMRTGRDKGYSLMLEHAASYKKNEVLYQTLPSSGFLLYQSFLSPDIIHLKTQGRVGYGLKALKSGLNGTFSHDYRTGYAILSEQMIGVQNQIFSFGLSMTCEPSKRIHLQAGHQHTRSSQYYSGRLALAFEEDRTTAHAYYKHGLWRANLSLARNWQRIGLSPNRFWLLGFEVERRFQKPPIRLRLTGRNVLNLRGNKMILPDFGANYTGFSVFETIGGQILGSVAYIF